MIRCNRIYHAECLVCGKPWRGFGCPVHDKCKAGTAYEKSVGGEQSESTSEEQIQELSEINRLVTRSARRCVRDMQHMLANIDPDDPEYSQWEERISVWSNIFWNASDYRDSLHKEIYLLETQLRNAQELLDQHGISELPF